MGVGDEELLPSYAPTWEDFLLQGRLSEFLQKGQVALTRSFQFRAKDKGKGKFQAKGKTINMSDWTDY